MTDVWEIRDVEVRQEGFLAHIRKNEILLIEPGLPMAPDTVTIRFDSMDNLNTWIDRVQSLKVLAIEHFGEDWGK